MKVLVATSMAALLLLACSKESAPTKAEYNAAADGVCQVAHDELVELTEEHLAKKPDGGANQRFVRAKLIPRLKAMTAQLRGITAPENDGAYLADIYDSYDHALDLTYGDPLGDTGTGPGDQAEARLESYGMRVCPSVNDPEELEGKG